MVHQMIDIGPAPRFAGAKGMIEYPIVRDMDTNMYERQEGTGLEIGSYAHRPITLDADEIPSIEESALTPTELPFTQDDFDPQMEIALELMPEIVGDESVGVKYAINGVLSVTLDGMPLLGETPEVRGLWSAAAVWIKEGPGVGQDGRRADGARRVGDRRLRVEHRPRLSPPEDRGARQGAGVGGLQQDVRDRPPLRAVGVQPVRAAARRSTSASASWGRSSSRRWAGSARSGTSPTRALLEEYGDRVTRREAEWESRWWSPIINAEHLAMRDRAAMVDLTAFAVFDITGPGALDAVQRIAMRQMDVAVGRVVYTPILTPSGGFKADLTIMRLDDQTSSGWSPAAPTGCRTCKWFADHLPADGSAQIHDQTQLVVHARAVGSAGPGHPGRRDQRRRLPRGLPVRALPDDRGRAAAVLASRISYVGDLGWELYVPIEQGARLWDIDRRGRRAARRRPGGDRRLRHHRAAGEVLPGLRRRARGGLQRGRGRDGLGEGQGPGLHRQGGPRAPPRGGARRRSCAR